MSEYVTACSTGKFHSKIYTESCFILWKQPKTRDSWLFTVGTLPFITGNFLEVLCRSFLLREELELFELRMKQFLFFLSIILFEIEHFRFLWREKFSHGGRVRGLWSSVQRYSKRALHCTLWDLALHSFRITWTGSIAKMAYFKAKLMSSTFSHWVS